MKYIFNSRNFTCRCHSKKMFDILPSVLVIDLKKKKTIYANDLYWAWTQDLGPSLKSCILFNEVKLCSSNFNVDAINIPLIYYKLPKMYILHNV